jgi:hypothetical protein
MPLSRLALLLLDALADDIEGFEDLLATSNHLSRDWQRAPLNIVTPDLLANGLRELLRDDLVLLLTYSPEHSLLTAVTSSPRSDEDLSNAWFQLSAAGRARHGEYLDSPASLMPEEVADWMAGERFGSIAFDLNQSVSFLGDTGAREIGAVIALLATGSDPLFLVELRSGTDVEVRQSRLQVYSAE